MPLNKIDARMVQDTDGKSIHEKLGIWSGKVDEHTTQLADVDQQFNATIDGEEVELGAELLDATGWTSTGWTGDFTTGFTHIKGQSASLTRSIPSTAGKTYRVELTLSENAVVDNGQSDFWITLGGSAEFETYRGYALNKTFVFGIKAIDDSGLKIRPWSNYEGTITNISVKEITGTLEPTLVIKDSDGYGSFEIRPDHINKYNVLIGRGAGQRSFAGDSNVAVGVNALRDNVSGFWNQAFGRNALLYNTNGSRNVALGYGALQSNLSGDRNIAVGTFSLYRVTTGRCNIGIGADALWYTTTGSHNIGVGLGAVNQNTIGEQNIGLGQDVLHSNTTGSNNIALGYKAAQQITTSNSNVSIGRASMFNALDGSDNVAVGYNSLLNKVNGEGNVSIGASTAGGGSTNPSGQMTRNVFLGKNVGANLTDGSYNVILGASSGAQADFNTGSNNILIGYAVTLPSGYHSNYLSIGALINGKLDTKQVGIGVGLPTAKLHLQAGTSGAGTAPLKFNSGTLMTTPESGAIEFNGTNLYFTTSTGVRKTIATI